MQVANEIYFAAVEEQLSEGRQVRLLLSGTSMQSALHPGDELTLAPMEGEPRVGDVVLFRYAGRHLLHRVVAVDGDQVTLQGDNCYTCERCRRQDIVGRLTAVRGMATDGPEWQRLSRRSLRRKGIKNFAIRWLGRKGRRQLRPWYFAALTFLMWAPLNGVGIPLDNYILGLRADHLLHASVFLPCAFFLMDLFRRAGERLRPSGRARTWLVAVAIGLLSEGVQWLLPWRGFDINDLIANTLGVTLGWLVVLAVLRHRR